MTLEEKKSYALGVAAAVSYKNMKIDIHETAFSKGFFDLFNNRNLEITSNEIQDLLTLIQVDIDANAKKESSGEKEKGIRFLEENAKRADVKTTSSGLQYRVIVESIGKKPTAFDSVTVHYHGKLIDGTVFDSSVMRGQTIEFPLNQVIKGWTEGLQLMSEGSKFEFFIPSELAYGESGAGEVIPPGATLIFEVELFKVK